MSSVRELIPLTAWMDQAPGEGGSRPLLALAADGNQYWVKLATNRQGSMVPANEQIVGRCGALIGAPTCQVALVEVPETMTGRISGVQVEAGVAHGSLHVPDTVNERILGHRVEDDNRRRHAGLFALHDWCWGRDSQWLFALSDEHKTYSHDHGHFFPGGPDWRARLPDLREHVDDPHLLQEYFDATGLDVDAVRTQAAALDAVNAADLVDILCAIPVEWPVADADLEMLGFFLERRAPQVAIRVRSLVE